MKPGSKESAPEEDIEEQNTDEVWKVLSFAVVSFSLQFGAEFANSQTPVPVQAGSLRGQVTDPSAAAIATANMVLVPATLEAGEGAN